MVLLTISHGIWTIKPPRPPDPTALCEGGRKPRTLEPAKPRGVLGNLEVSRDSPPQKTYEEKRFTLNAESRGGKKERGEARMGGP